MTTTTLYKFIQSELINRGHNEFFDSNNRLVLFDSDHQFTTKIFDFDNDVQDITDHLFNGLSLDDPIHDEHFKKTFLFRFMNRQINRQTIESFKFELMNTFLTSKSYINRVYQDSEKYILQYSESEGTSQELSNEISQMVNEQITEQLDRRENEEQNSSQSKQNTINDSIQNTTGQTSENSKQESNQTADGRTDTDNRSARSDLPQNTVNLNLDNRTMTTANENEISRNRTDDNRTTDTTTDTDTSGNQTSETTNNETGSMTTESSGELSGESTGETSTDTKGKSDTERDSTRDGKTTGSQISYRLDELFKSNGLMEGIFNTFDRKCFLQTW